ncbi:MAG: hypothetical protein AAF840_02615, partial [Bacteroidota bacterium]
FNQLQFGDGSTSESLPAQTYGIQKALNIAQFNPYHTNIMIVLGTKGDFTSNPVWGRKAPKVLKPDRDYITSEINRQQVSLFGIQCAGGTLRTDLKFADGLVGTIGNAAHKYYNEHLRRDRFDPAIQKLLDESEYQYPRPFIHDPGAEPQLLHFALQSGTVAGSVDRILEKKVRETSDLREKLATYVMNTVKSNLALVSQIEQWKTGDLREGGYNIKTANVLKGLPPDLNANIKWTWEKFELYQEVYFATQPQGANNRTFSYVLFWTKEGLKEYRKALRDGLSEIDDQTEDEQREQVRDFYCQLIEEFTGNDGEGCEKYTIAEIANIIQGVEKEGIPLAQNEVKIDDLLNKRKVPRAKLQEIIRELARVYQNLDKLIKGADQDFVFKRNNTQFYWVKASDLYF